MNSHPSENIFQSKRFAPRLIFPLILYALGILLLAWAYLNPSFRDSTDFPNAGILLPIAVGLGALFVARAFRNAWKKFSIWFSLGLVGQAVALQMIDAGTAIHYQHYVPLSALIVERPWLVLFLLFQTILVSVAIARRFSTIRAWLSHAFRPWQIFVIVAVSALSAVALSRDLGGYVSEVAWATFLQLVNLGNLVLMVWALPAHALDGLQRRIGDWGQSITASAEKNPSLDRYAVLAAVFATVAAALLVIFSYEQHPHIADEVAYLIHARFLAADSWTLPAPAVPQAFETYLMQFQGDQWFAVTPPGWPALLSLGVRLGIPWLVNPILAGINVLLAYLLIQELFDRKTARLALFLLCVSPWYLFMSMNLMTHTFTLTCALAAAVLVAWAKRQNNMLWGFLAGGFVGAGSLIRPLDGLIVAVLLGAWLLGAHGMRARAFLVSAFVLGALLTGAVVLPYNAGLTGKATVFPLNAYLDAQFGPGRNDLGFGENRGLGWALQPFPGHSPLGAAVNTALNTFSLNTELFGWSVGSLCLVVLFLVSGKMQRRDYLMLAVIVVTVGVFALYWYSGGPDFGARYWYIVLIPCVVLTIRGLQVLQSKFVRTANGLQNPAAYALSAVLILSLFGLINYIPWRALDKYHDYLSMQPDIQTLSSTWHFGKSLVLVRGESFPDYASAVIYNPLDWKAAQPIYAWDRDEAARNALLAAYLDRPVWIIEGPSLTHNGYRVIAGPLAPSALLGRASALP